MGLLMAKKQQPKEIYEKAQALIDDGLDPNTRVSEMRMTTRTFNCLRRNQIITINDLLQYTDKQLLELPNFGIKCVKDLWIALDEIYRRSTRTDIYIWVNENIGLVKTIRDASVHEPVLLLPFKERMEK